MGRMITGDINGKCWFGIQDSNFADRFGVTGTQPDILTYYFDTSNLDEIESELKNIEKELGDNLEKLKTFFNKNLCYTRDDIAKCLGLESYDSEVYHMISEYADYEYGKQILDCVKNYGYCEFEVEL